MERAVDISSVSATVLLDVLVTAIKPLSGSLVVPRRLLGAWPGCPGVPRFADDVCHLRLTDGDRGAEGRGWGSGVGPAVMGVLLDRDGVQVGSDVLREAGRRQLLGTTIPRRGWLLSAGVSVGSEPAGAGTKPAPSGRSAPARVGWAPRSCATPSSRDRSDDREQRHVRRLLHAEPGGLPGQHLQRADVLDHQTNSSWFVDRAWVSPSSTSASTSPLDVAGRLVRSRWGHFWLTNPDVTIPDGQGTSMVRTMPALAWPGTVQIAS